MEKVLLNSKRWLDVRDLENERWAVIDEYPNYAVSNYGRVKRLEHDTEKYVKGVFFCIMHLKERIVRQTPNRTGYLAYRPTGSDGSLGEIYTHRLVAKYFVPNPNNYPCVNHKDEDKSNNYVCLRDDGSIDEEKSNLEWCTDKYNSNYGTCQERRAVSVKKMRRERQVAIDQYTIQGHLIRHYSNKGELDDAGFNVKTVCQCCMHMLETAQGYVWRYSDEPFSKPSYNDSKGGTIKKKVLCYDLNGKFVAQYDSLLEAAIAMGGKNKRGRICTCAYGKAKQAFGYIWKYKED